MNIQTKQATETTGNEIVVFDRKYVPAELFVPGTMDPLIGHIRETVMSEDRDPTTPKGRERIKSLAYKVTRTKTAIDSARKELVSAEKMRLAAIDAEGRRVREELDILADEVRQPVTEYENREKERVEAHKVAADAIGNMDHFDFEPTSADIEKRLVETKKISTDHEEFSSLAETAKATVIESLTKRLEFSRKAEAERTELERLRREAAEREQREREEAAAAKAKAEAEEAARIREEEARKAAEVERQRVQREAEQRESEIRAAAETKEREAAKRREKEAVERERQRAAEEKRAKEEAARKREADKKHMAKINNEALSGLLTAANLDEAGAKQAIGAIAKGQVPHVSIQY